MAYFIKWWYSDTIEYIRDLYKDFISEGVIAIEHGGMVQHDEALPDWKSVVTMFDGSLQFIKQQFGTLPKIAFSIDAFGHSSITPYILTALGYEAIVIMRIPHDIDKGMSDKK